MGTETFDTKIQMLYSSEAYEIPLAGPPWARALVGRVMDEGSKVGVR
eukprot:CAMPEP_0184479630 /NCGR_PEP_ID=MMETSP0113_2-20130426/1279_1 /TAXON_ID=91329 /ORGANISM="Norrisiella sphaerica, Strain BC52" /LENGTH=46 /DNA_ID= /DNA_START= /DNA_END= /DNA_ORIENTATION=